MQAGHLIGILSLVECSKGSDSPLHVLLAGVQVGRYSTPALDLLQAGVADRGPKDCSVAE